MRATFYARVSTNSEEQQSSIESQIDFFQKYLIDHNFQKADCGIFCKRDGSAEVADGYYVDEGFSASKAFKYRRAFQQMINDAKLRKFDMIFVKDIKRFGRNAQETLKFIGDLKELGIGIYFDTLNANTLRREDDFRIQLFASLAEEESTSKSQSVQWGKKTKYEKGIWGGREPYGYNIKDGKLVINEQESITVKDVFDLYLNQSMGLRNIAKHLNDKKIPTKSGKAIFDQSLISKMLKNAVYTGEIRLHRTKKVDINRNIIVAIPEHEQVVTHDESLRVIDDETFRLVQIEKEKRFKQFGDFNYKETVEENEDGEELSKKVRTITRGDSRHSNKHLFSNILKCGNCGGSLRRKVQNNPNNTYTYWFCRNNDTFGKHKCGYRNLHHEEKLIAFVKEEIKNYIKTPKKGKFYLDKILKNRYDTKDIEKKIIIIKAEIEEKKIEREANFKLYSKALITDDEYVERNNLIKSDLYDAESSLNQLIYIEDEIEKLNARYNQFIKALNEVDVDNLTNAILRKFINRIVAETHEEPIFEGAPTFEPHTLEVEWNFLDTTEKQLLQEDTNRIIKRKSINP